MYIYANQSDFSVYGTFCLLLVKLLFILLSVYIQRVNDLLALCAGLAVNTQMSVLAWLSIHRCQCAGLAVNTQMSVCSAATVWECVSFSEDLFCCCYSCDISLCSG